jgi:homoserine kinase
VIAGILGANSLLEGALNQDDILKLAVEIEGHPDNCAPALLGGLVVVGYDLEGNLVTRKIVIPSLKISVAVPRFDFPTQTAREALPNQISLQDAAENIGRAVLVTQAFHQGDLGLLGKVMEDKLHQPYRLPLIPGAQAAMKAAREAGAAAVALSGAGPSLAAFSKNDAGKISDAMVKAFKEVGIKSHGYSLQISSQGGSAINL